MVLDAEVIDFLFCQGDRLPVGADEARGAAHVVHEMPALIGQHHLHEHVARKDLALDGLLTGIGDLLDQTYVKAEDGKQSVALTYVSIGMLTSWIRSCILRFSAALRMFAATLFS